MLPCGSALAGPAALVGVVWEVPATKRSPIDPFELFLRELNYGVRIKGNIDSYYIPDKSEILDDKKNVLVSVNPAGKPGDPIPPMDKVSNDPVTYETKGSYPFRFAPPIPDATAAIRFGGGYFAASDKPTIGVINSKVTYENLDGTRSVSATPKEARIEFTTFWIVKAGEDDPDLQFVISNPVEERVRVEDLQYLIAEEELPYAVPMEDTTGFLDFPSVCGAAFWLDSGASSEKCLFSALLPGQWLYVKGSAYVSASSSSAFLYGIHLIPEPGSAALAGLALVGVLAASANRRTARKGA